MPRLTLLVNGDDTLWERSVIVEKTLERFFPLVEHFGYARAYTRHVLNETERINIRQHGYGVRSFARSLGETYRKLAGGLAQPGTLREIESLVQELERTPPRVLPGVPATLDYLAPRHRMILFTQGEAAEEVAKVERSGLQKFFAAIEIVAERSATAYNELVQKHHVVKTHGWLVGPTTESDVNPALQAGLNAAFVPHPGSSDPQPAELQRGGGTLLIVSKFSDLKDHF